MPGLVKRSMQIKGHSTSLALDPEFWRVVEDLAAKNHQSMPATIQTIDAGKGRIAGLFVPVDGTRTRSNGADPHRKTGRDEWVAQTR